MKPAQVDASESPALRWRLPFFYGWVILAVSTLAIFFSGPAIFIDPMIQELGWSRPLISCLYSLGTLAAGFVMVFVGRLVDRVGSFLS